MNDEVWDKVKTQSEEIMLQVDNKDKEGVVHGFWTVQSKKLRQEVTRER